MVFLLFIVLLENVFKYGVEWMREGVYVILYLVVEWSWIIFIIENNFKFMISDKFGGIGLDNFKKRLEYIYFNCY